MRRVTLLTVALATAFWERRVPRVLLLLAAVGLIGATGTVDKYLDL